MFSRLPTSWTYFITWQYTRYIPLCSVERAENREVHTCGAKLLHLAVKRVRPLSSIKQRTPHKSAKQRSAFLPLLFFSFLFFSTDAHPGMKINMHSRNPPKRGRRLPLQHVCSWWSNKPRACLSAHGQACDWLLLEVFLRVGRRIPQDFP